MLKKKQMALEDYPLHAAAESGKEISIPKHRTSLILCGQLLGEAQCA